MATVFSGPASGDGLTIIERAALANRPGQETSLANALAENGRLRVTMTALMEVNMAWAVTADGYLQRAIAAEAEVEAARLIIQELKERSR